MNLTQRIGVAAVAAAMPLAGCVRYERQPLTLSTHTAVHTPAALDVASVAAYLRERAAAESTPDAVFDVTDGIDRREAEAIALHFHPQLRMARAEAEVPLASAEEAGWWPDPQVEVEILRFANRGQQTRFGFDGPSFDGVNTGILGGGGALDGLELTPPGIRRTGGDRIEDPWIVGASLSLTVPISGRLAVEKDLKWAEYTAAGRQIVAAEWELILRLRRTWARWSATRRQQALLEQHMVDITEAAAITDRLAEAGEVASTAARLLSIERARQTVRQNALADRAQQQQLELFALMGVAPHAPFELTPNLAAPPQVADPARQRADLLEHNPLVQLARANYEAAEQRLRLEIRNQYPDLNIGPSFSFEEGFSRLGLGFGMPLPLWNRNRQAVAEAAAAREAARVRAEATVEDLDHRLARAQASLEHAVQRRALLTERVAPLVDRQVEETRRLLDIGEVDAFVLRDALVTSLETKLDVVEVLRDEALAAAELEHLLDPHRKAGEPEEIDE